MGEKLVGIRLYRINADALVIASKRTPSIAVREFYERTELIEADDVRIVPLFDKTGADERETFADVIERTDFDPERLPALL